MVCWTLCALTTFDVVLDECPIRRAFSCMQWGDGDAASPCTTQGKQPSGCLHTQIVRDAHEHVATPRRQLEGHACRLCR